MLLWGLLVQHVFLKIISIQVDNMQSIGKCYLGKINWHMKEN